MICGWPALAPARRWVSQLWAKAPPRLGVPFSAGPATAAGRAGDSDPGRLHHRRTYGGRVAKGNRSREGNLRVVPLGRFPFEGEPCVAQGNRLGLAPHPAVYATRGLELTAAATLASLRRGYRGRRPAGCTRCPCSESRLCPSYLKDPTPGEGGSFPGRDAIRTGTAFSRDCSAQIPPAPPLASRLRALRAAPRPRRRRGSGRGCGRRFGGPPKPPPPPRRPRRGRRRV